MPKSTMQKKKLLYLQKILLEKTDEKHGISINEIKAELAKYGIDSERKSLYDDLEILRTFGLDICRIKTNTVKYYVGSRDFQIPELKLLVDAIQCSKFITRKKSLELIGKLEHLVSENEGTQLHRQVYVTNRVKTVNERIYYNVDRIHSAILSNKKISFVYFRWEVDFDSPQKIKRVARKNGEPYVISPWALCWDDENYYLIGYDSHARMIKHYRVDKMEEIEQIDSARNGSKVFESFNLAQYAKTVFSMFGGEETNVRLSVDNNMIGVIVDRFGTDINIVKESDISFTVNVNVILSPQFYAWVFGMGNKVRIVSPQSAVIGFYKKFEDFKIS